MKRKPLNYIDWLIAISKKKKTTRWEEYNLCQVDRCAFNLPFQSFDEWSEQRK